MRAARAAWSAVVVGVVLATPATARADTGPTVLVHQYRYHDPAITVPIGTAVTWTNEDTAEHDVTTSTGPTSFRSPLLATGRSFTYDFTAPGTYQYLCSIHPDMVGSVTVTAAPTTTLPLVPTTAPPPVATTQGAGAGVPTSTTTEPPTVAASGSSEAAAAPVAAVPAASVGDDLSSSARPYLLLLALAAVVVAGALTILLAGRRGPADA
jgi:plastocyanin